MAREWKVVVITGWFPALTKMVIGKYRSYAVAELVAVFYQLLNPLCWVSVEKPDEL